VGFNNLMWVGKSMNCFLAEKEPLSVYKSEDGITWNEIEDKEKIASAYENMGAAKEWARIKRVGAFKRFLGKF